ncbi:MAG: glycine zipper domain-containing protein [Fuerstiella sp.]|jgi:uncharacterized protein YcfJ
MRRFLVPLLVIAALPLSSASAQYRTQRGSVLGGLAGAAAGVAIGEHNDKPVAGALIGGAVGMVAGAALGNSQDRRAAEQRAYQYQQQQQQQQSYIYQQQQLSRTVSLTDVIAMSRSGLSDAVIINHIQANGVRQDLQVADVITLHENGVSQQVISAMQRPPVTSSVPTTLAPAPVYHTAPPIVVEQYVPPRYIYPAPRPYYSYGHRPGHYGHGVGAHISFGR